MKSRILALCVSMLFALTHIAEPTKENDATRLRDTSGRMYWIVPHNGDGKERTWKQDSHLVSAERHGTFIRYQAVINDKTEMVWIPTKEKMPRLALNLSAGKWVRLSTSLRITMKDYSKLDSVVQESGAKRGAAFPKLGFALIEVADNETLNSLASRLNNIDAITDVRIQVERPIAIPN